MTALPAPFEQEAAARLVGEDLHSRLQPRHFALLRAATGGQSAGPWYRAHPAAALAVIAFASAAVLGLQLVDRQASDAIALLYVMPIGLAAVAFGTWGGVAAASVAYLAFGMFALLGGTGHVGPDGWLSRGAAMFLLGALLGRASDQTARAEQVSLAHQRERLVVEEANRRYCEGIELSDSILQHVAAAKWKIEQGDSAGAAELLAKALAAGQEMISELLPDQSAADGQVPEP